MKQFFTAWVMLGLVISAEAVIVADGDGTQNTNAPSGGQGWDYVGRIDKSGIYSSVTYISNNWFITAYHIKTLDNPTGVLLGGTDYSIDPNSWTRLTNSNDENADLVMFRIVGGSVGLPGLIVRSSGTPVNAELTMIGNGRNRAADETTWNHQWAEEGIPPLYNGYKWASGSAKRWGRNNKDLYSGMVNTGYGTTDVMRTSFDDNSTNEAQGAVYDSGGGVFYENGSNWELAGIMLTIGTYQNQPSSTAVHGNVTYIADIEYYAEQITTVSAIDDVDEDGIPDDWEYEQMNTTVGVSASEDQDGDGFDGAAEWIADTDPTDGNSYLKLEAYTNAASMVFSSSLDREYRIEYCSDLIDLNWQTEEGWFRATGPMTVRSVSTADSNRVYRVRVKLP
ncbi:hypothetical protein [Pontiella agarivorans]|uniref:Peptidase S1 domain-containing protein n=1 Tax=Pontiella agarivorans TaxID=3038953 RepID=A0ABU5MXK0_9BACT|nr:hypothetical protein [Pontiella agarivorans]MDZ8118924.1 hypothetical protein [Pontiella agarivorans]